MQFDVPNLDGLDAADLAALRDVFRLLGAYADDRRRAMEYRERGQVQTAINNEQLMQGLYDRLPEWARW